VSRDSSVGIPMGYGWTVGFRFPAGARDFSLLHSVQTESVAHPASYPVGTGGGGRFHGVKHPGREADHSSPSRAEVKNGGAISPLHIRLNGIVLN
jgi:hypothetical protein